MNIIIFYNKNQRKIEQVAEAMRSRGYSINNDIRNKKALKNPSIYEQFIEAHKIDEFGSNLSDVCINYTYIF